MFCNNCGEQLLEGAKFCGNCGIPISLIDRDDVDDTGLDFYKRKKIGSVIYKQVYTTVHCRQGALEIDQKISRFFRSDIISNTTLFLDQIQYADVHTVLDFWDTLYAVIFAVSSIFYLYLLLPAAICAACAYGKELRIVRNDGTAFRIPFQDSQSINCASQILSICNRETEIR